MKRASALGSRGRYTLFEEGELTIRMQGTRLWLWCLPFIALASAALPSGRDAAHFSTRAASVCGDSAAISWLPDAPRQGALFRVRVTGVAPGTRLGGKVADQPLHFVRVAGDNIAESFAAVPIDGDRSLGIVLRCYAGTREDSLVGRLEAARANYPIDRLKVAPRFATPPDSATAERIRRESERALEVATNAHLTPRLWNEPFILPRQSRITSGFGHGREYNGTLTSRHMGTDFAGAIGAPVRAANRGVVRIVDAFYYGGNVVYVDHGAGLTSAYLHLSQQGVAAGDTVARGQVIGRVGASGRVTGPHLHLIVRYGNVTVDPMSLFAIAGESPPAHD
jgi:murein DD-endopeptidase MepM/ murein hydrolase activator NlpD